MIQVQFGFKRVASLGSPANAPIASPRLLVEGDFADY
jgi:hypothetical protein